LVVAPLACSLVHQQHAVRVVEGSLAAHLYGEAERVEAYYCNYGLDRQYVPALAEHGLVVSGIDEEDEPRIMELTGHPFFVTTLFVPQMRKAHPLVEGFLAAARGV
jgi:CTP synthase (UTP-ammonia lyase)